MDKVWQMDAMLGGPTPLSNGIVASLLMGGLQRRDAGRADVPERYLQRGKLRRTLGTPGAAGGVGLGLNNAYANASGPIHRCAVP
jgi:hypothetical protein